MSCSLRSIMVIGQQSVVNNTEKIAMITTISLVGLGILQIILGGTISRSVSLIANGIDSIGDGFISGIVLVGLRFFRRPADQRFHFWYYKLENLASIVVTLVMFLLASYIVFRSYNQLDKSSGRPTSHSWCHRSVYRGVGCRRPWCL
jgi:divalent metal cation (Fe/Co/Zn/Cd) transporter